MKTSQDNDMTDRIILIYIENDTKHSGPIRLGAIYDETKQDNDVIDLPHAIYTKNETELLWPIELDTVCHENQIG